MTSIAAFEEAAREHGHGVIVVLAASASRPAVAAAVRDLLGHHVDGALVVAPGAAWLPGLPGLVAHLPVVAPWCGPQHPASVMYPSIDQRAGARQLISHLVALGHRRVLHLAGQAGWTMRRPGCLPTSRSCGSRACRACRLWRVTGPRHPVTPPGAPCLSAGAAGSLGSAPSSRPTTRCAWPGPRAPRSGNRGAARCQRRRIDDIPQAAYFWPPLTTVRQDFGELGRRQVAALLAGQDGAADFADGADGAALEPLLVVRSSVAAAPGGLPGHGDRSARPCRGPRSAFRVASGNMFPGCGLTGDFN